MDNLIRKKLQDLIAHRGQGLCMEPDRCKAAVKELCARHPAEQFVLASIVDLGMLPQIIAAQAGDAWSDLATELAGRLHSERSLNRDAARWGVDTWAVALGKIDEAALRISESVALGRGQMPLERRLLAAFVAGAIYGLLLWLVGWAVTWGFADAAKGALIGAALGAFGALTDGVLSPWVIAAWAAGGAAGVLLFQGTDGEAIEPLTGTVAWMLSWGVGRAILLGLANGQGVQAAQGAASLHLAAFAGLIGPGIGWPTAGLITAAANGQLEAPWNWALVGLCAGALQGVLQESYRSWRRAVAYGIVRAAMGAVFALGAGFLSDHGPLGWILTGTLVWLVPGLLYRPQDRHSQSVWRVAVSPSGNFALSAGLDSNIGLWQLDRRTLVGFVRHHVGPVYAVAFSNDGLFCASGGADLTVRVVDGNTGDQVHGFTGHTDTVLAVTFSPADGLLVSGSADATVRVWDLSAGKETRCLQGHTGPVSSVGFSRDGGFIVSASLDGTARIWDATTGKETASLDVKTPVHAAVFTPDGRQVVVAADGGLSVWDVAARQRVRALAGHAGAVYGVAVRADGACILSAGDDGAIRLWACQTGEELACIHGHHGPVRTVAFTHNGRAGLSSGDDGTVRLFGFPASPLGESADEEDDEEPEDEFV